MSNWIEIVALEEIPRLGSRVVTMDTVDVAVFRTASDEVFAIKDECPHMKGPLSQGIVHDSTVTCPLHNWVLELDSGEALAPDEGCAASYPVNVDGGRVYISLEV